MKKNILIKLASIAAAVSLLVGGAYAAFTSNQTTITGVVLSSATPTLQVQASDHTWHNSVSGANLRIEESNMYPGFVGAEHKFYLRNTSDASVPFGQIVANLPSETGDWDAIKYVVEMQFGETGVGWTSGWHTLNWWNNHSADILGLDLSGGNTYRQFSVQFKMLSTADDSARGKTETIVLRFVGMTP